MYEKYTVLFVDDEANIQKAIRRLMMDEEFTSVFASSGQEAIEIINKNKISVVVSDMRMPEMNGLELLKIVEEISPLTVKLVLTGYTQIPQILSTVNQVDIYKFMAKPWEPEELVELVKKSIDYYIIKEEYASQKKILETQNKSYKNILAKINTVINDAKNSSQIICRCGSIIVDFGVDFTIEQREAFKDVFEIQRKLFECLSSGVAFDKSIISLKTLMDNISKNVLSVVTNARIISKSDMNAQVNIEEKILETAISVAVLIFHKEFINNGLVISVENTEKFHITMLCPDIKYNDADNSVKTVIDSKNAFIKSFLTELLWFSQIQLSQSVINDTLILKIGVDTDELNC